MRKSTTSTACRNDHRSLPWPARGILPAHFPINALRPAHAVAHAQYMNLVADDLVPDDIGINDHQFPHRRAWNGAASKRPIRKAGPRLKQAFRQVCGGPRIEGVNIAVDAPDILDDRSRPPDPHRSGGGRWGYDLAAGQPLQPRANHLVRKIVARRDLLARPLDRGRFNGLVGTVEDSLGFGHDGSIPPATRQRKVASPPPPRHPGKARGALSGTQETGRHPAAAHRAAPRHYSQDKRAFSHTS